MKHMKRMFAVLCAVLLFVPGALRAKAEPYKYTVTVLAGLHGQFKEGDKNKTEFKVAKDVQWNPTEWMEKLEVTDERFYLKGFHISGIEDLVPTTPITEDTVFVASYGLKGQTVAYTVRYQDAAGNTLHPTRTFYGNIGDKPVIAYQYIDGFVPRVLNLTKTLSANEADNVFTFTYVPGTAIIVEGGGGTTGVTGYTYTDGGVQIVYLPGQNNGGNQNAAGNQNAGGNQNGVNPNNAAPANQQNAADTDANAANAADQPAQGPTEIVDLDDTDAPLANVTSPEPEGQVTPANPKPGLNGFWIGALGLSGLGIFSLIAILIALLRRKRRDSYQG